MDLSIIILSFNTKELTINCLKSIVDQYQSELKNNKFEIALVDNNSSDGTLEAVRKLIHSTSSGQNLKIVESKENLGFSRGCNLGAKSADGEYLLFLNSDTEIKDQGFIKMVDYFRKNEKVGILGGALRSEDGKAQLSVGKFYNLFNLLIAMLGLERFGFLRESPNKIKKVDWVSGANLMIERKLFEKIGGFEKELFMYAEDMELCYRVKKKGLSTYFYPDVTLFHKELGSSNRTFAILNIYKGILFFYKKYKPGWQFQIARLILFSKALLLVLVGKIMNNRYLKETYLQTLKL
jgi:GT2 family glycosyltransferase